MKTGNLYNPKQIANITGYSLSCIYFVINKLKLAPEYTRYRVSHYDDDCLNLIIKSLENAPREKVFTKFYPIKTIETFYIYESKMNYDNPIQRS